jgi:hypothetical protein
MGTVLTVRTDAELRRALDERARALGVAVSELVRKILHEALVERPLGDRTAPLRGRLTLGRRSSDPLRAQLRRRNWRP